jgi:hypothetical protein
MTAVQRVELVSGRESRSYKRLLRDRWRNIVVPNVHAPTEDKCNETNESCYEKL